MNKNTFSGFPAITGGGIPEAPIDGKAYGRQDGEWTNINTLIESAITGFLSEGEIEV